MKEITVNEIGACITNALTKKTKNLLFISATLEYDNALEWFAAHPDYCMGEATPQALWENKDGRLVKSEDCFVLTNDDLNKMNDEKAIWFIHALGDACVENFEGFLNIIENRFYVNTFTDGTSQRFSLEKMGMFIAFTSPTKGDWARLDEKHYHLFDEIYVVV